MVSSVSSSSAPSRLYKAHGLRSLPITWGAEFSVGVSRPAPSDTAAALLDCAVDT
ncbi:hypothetical protein PC123_g19317 [Phytophthora cactorum]|nr:hypothetical protein PC123_g19317 [Phytophthora cactorum]